ncbi:phosphotransferase [Dictyobacter formicarum]|uniref:Acyl-CoA dehydrogenase n=1 Tax=Dictyobacter formicarum TaxID=2778368 RepID=A0ABQ3VID2_9CHLR|nr:phosphotransferase [Dictyobacter formicarum]GHO85810.1 acyl-CoA dehydrogenase [Dictyobacter formicarum]
MTALLEDNKFARVVQKIDPQATLLRSWELKGGVSAQVTALEVQLASGDKKMMIVRRHGENDLRRNPQIAADEFKLLQILHAGGLATPAPYYLDQSGAIFATPYVVIEYIEGETIFAPALAPVLIPQLATHLASIHALDCTQLDLSFLPDIQQAYSDRLRVRPATPDASLSEGRIRDALEASWPPHQRNTSALLHGDFWPGNILWKDRQLAAIVDWEDAALGDPLADLANSRLEILWAFGREAMEDFTQHYQSLNAIDYDNLPYWDLCAALRPAGQLSTWIADIDKERALCASHHWFITQALAQL